MFSSAARPDEIICDNFVKVYKNYTNSCEFMQIYG